MTVLARERALQTFDEIRRDLVAGTVRDEVIEDAMLWCSQLSIDVAEHVLVNLIWVHYGYQPGLWEDWLRWISKLSSVERLAFTALLLDVCEGDD